MTSLVQNGQAYQRFERLEILELVVAQTEVGQIVALLESVQTGADSIVAQFQLFQFWKLRKSLQTEIGETKK